MFRVTTWGESHGPAIGCVIDGCPPGLPLTAGDIQKYLDERRPGTSKYVTQRREPDAVKILSGVFEDEETGGPVTTGTPISLLIENVDQRSKDYSEIKDSFRPGHADFTYHAKYGVRDYRGGGRSSARETACRVAAGAVARKILGSAIQIRGALVEMGGQAVEPTRWDWDEVHNNPFWCPDAKMAKTWAAQLDALRKAGDSAGAIVHVEATGVPTGWGAPVYGKLDMDIAQALMGINAAKGAEIGAGFAAARLTGSQNADEIRMNGQSREFLSNNAGGILGGISSGQPITARVAIKPTSSILTKVQSVTRKGEEIDIQTKGRHDPCVGIRAVPVAEAMLACVLADHKLRHIGQIGASS